MVPSPFWPPAERADAPAGEHDDPPRRIRLAGLPGALLLGACYLVLLTVGGLLGLLGAFLDPLRVLGVEGISIVIAVVGNLLVGRLAGVGTGTRVGALMPAIGWLVVAYAASTTRPGGSLILTGSLAGDGAIGAVTLGFLVLGTVAALVPVAWGSGRPRWPARRRPPRTPGRE